VALEAHGLRVHYETDEGPVHAVEDLDLVVGRNRIVGLVGESGCGKTTLAMTVLGLIPSPGRVVGGTLRVDGRDLTAMPPADVARLRGRVMSLVPQSAMNALNPAYTVHRQIAEAASLTREPSAARRRATELLDLVGLAAERGDAYPHELSGGMRQRVVIAMALANDPALIVADEPLTGLDVLTQARIIRLLLDLQQQTGVAVLLVSHDLPLVSRVVDDLVVMYAGRVVESGTASQVTTSPHHPYTRDLLRAFPRLRGPRREVTSIPGRPPDLLVPPPGCPFHPRCSEAWDECTRIRPPRYPVGPHHDSACLLDRP
jgi:oligopeptide/dipeptide ABC transporter ATP-binding protein